MSVSIRQTNRKKAFAVFESQVSILNRGVVILIFCYPSVVCRCVSEELVMNCFVEDVRIEARIGL